MMAEPRATGKVRAIGLSNHDAAQLELAEKIAIYATRLCVPRRSLRLPCRTLPQGTPHPGTPNTRSSRQSRPWTSPVRSSGGV